MVSEPGPRWKCKIFTKYSGEMQSLAIHDRHVLMLRPISARSTLKCFSLFFFSSTGLLFLYFCWEFVSVSSPATWESLNIPPSRLEQLFVTSSLRHVSARSATVYADARLWGPNSFHPYKTSCVSNVWHFRPVRVLNLMTIFEQTHVLETTFWSVGQNRPGPPASLTWSTEWKVDLGSISVCTLHSSPGVELRVGTEFKERELNRMHSEGFDKFGHGAYHLFYFFCLSALQNMCNLGNIPRTFPVLFPCSNTRPK